MKRIVECAKLDEDLFVECGPEHFTQGYAPAYTGVPAPSIDSKTMTGLKIPLLKTEMPTWIIRNVTLMMHPHDGWWLNYPEHQDTKESPKTFIS